MRFPALRSNCLVIAACLAVAGAFGLAAPLPATAQKADKPPTRGQNRAAAYRLAELMPTEQRDWKAWRPKIDWSARSVYVHRRYRHSDGAKQFTLVFEMRSPSLLYRKDLLTDPEKAKRFNYTVGKVGAFDALIKDTSYKREIRFWVLDRILVYGVGTADVDTIKSHLESINFEEMKAIK